MRFWDSAAIVPLVFDEASSKAVRKLYEADATQAVWCLTPVEVWSAVARRRRDGKLGSPDMREARRRLEALSNDWLEIDDLASVRRRAQRLLEVHALRAGDALQLAAALVVVSDRPEGFGFVTFDTRLAEAAEAEAFSVVVPG